MSVYVCVYGVEPLVPADSVQSSLDATSAVFKKSVVTAADQQQLSAVM